ncbi:MAG TPA: hypothetical protein P5114_04880 [Hyphomicrobiaceae bacterium]|nr:hypothetical protein [Hyphomicrobiaceae bacterium]
MAHDREWKYQLVIQFDDEMGQALDQLIEFEDELMELLDGVAEVEGHDVGSGKATLFIMTDRPKKLWERLEPLIEDSDHHGLEPLVAAFSPADDDDYAVLWPSDYEGEFVVG